MKTITVYGIALIAFGILLLESDLSQFIEPGMFIGILGLFVSTVGVMLQYLWDGVE